MSPKSRLKNILSLFLRFGLSAALLGYLYHKIDMEKTVAVVKSADPGFIVYALLIFIVINFIILLRWMILVRALDLQAPLKDVARYFFIGLFGNLFLPSSIGGDVIKIIGLCRNSSQKPRVVASVILDRLSGFAGMVVVAVAAFLIGFQLIGDVSLVISIVLMAAGSAVIVTVLFNERVYSFCCQIFSRFPRLKEGLMRMHYDIALLRDKPAALIQAVGCSCLAQLMLAVVFFLTAKSLHQDVALPYFFIFVPLICVASSFPSIGGLGVREAGTAYLLAKVGVESGVAVSISLINFLFMVFAGLAGGVVYFMTKKSSPISLRQPVSETPIGESA